MEYASYRFTGNSRIPAEVSLGEYSTPVWIQQKWEEGEYAIYVQRNGCGHCCTAMALNLHGIKIDPHEEFTLCRKKWGKPRMGEPLNEDNFLSVSGIVKILHSFDVPAQYFGVPKGTCEQAAKHIADELTKGRQVILWSNPSDRLPNNPFSTGDHYVLAVGYTADGNLLIANSSNNGATDNGIQYTDTETIAAVLYDGCDPQDFTWGRYDLPKNGGYVVIGK